MLFAMSLAGNENMKAEACASDTPDSLLLRYKADMLAPFRALGKFWDADSDSYPPSAGILSWHPEGESCLSVLPTETENGLADVLEPQGKPACLHGKWLTNIDGTEMGASYLSVEAVTAGGAEGYGPYRYAERKYAVSSVWAGGRLIKPSETVFSQVAFSFRGLDDWADPKTDVPTREHNGRLVIAGSKWDVLRNMDIADLGNLRLLGGYAVSGTHGKSETLRVSHIWYVDFCSPKTWIECRQILDCFAEILSDDSGITPDLRTLTLAEKTEEALDDDIFTVRMTDNQNLAANENLEIGYQGPQMLIQDAEETKFENFIRDYTSQQESDTDKSTIVADMDQKVNQQV